MKEDTALKINQAAELVNITSKNIRFYEDQGLVDPSRNPANGYREYSLIDVEQLKKIKLLRSLGVSCDSIRKMNQGELSLERCMRERLRELDESAKGLDHMKAICTLMADEEADISTLDPSLYLEKMKESEKGGVRFMNVKNSDVNKRKAGAIIACAVVVAFLAVMIGLIIWADTIDPAPKGILIFSIALFGSIIIGVIIALVQRLKEVKGGELDEAGKY